MPASTPTLRDMIQEAADVNRGGQTYDQLAKRAQDQGETVSGAYLNNIALGKVSRPPRAEHLRAIAAALGKPYEAVVRAAISQWWLTEEGGSTEEDLRSEARRLREAAERMEKRLDTMGEGGVARGTA